MIASLPCPGIALSSAARTCAWSGTRSNFRMTIVPPENSTPFGSPVVAITKTPARMIAHERPIAYQRQRRKSMFVCLKMCMAVGLSDAQARDLPLAEDRFEQGFRHERRGEEVGDESDEQRRREAANRTGAELEEKRRRNQRGDVRIDQRQPDAAEAGVNRRAHAPLRLQFLL